MKHWPAFANNILNELYKRTFYVLLLVLVGQVALMAWDVVHRRRTQKTRKTLKWFLQMVPLVVRLRDTKVKHIFKTI